jgi:hypothetical protein
MFSKLSLVVVGVLAAVTLAAVDSISEEECLQLFHRLRHNPMGEKEWRQPEPQLLDATFLRHLRQSKNV